MHGLCLRQTALDLLAAGCWGECASTLQQAHQQQAGSQGQGIPSSEWIHSKEALQALIIARTHALATSKSWGAVLSPQAPPYLISADGQANLSSPAAVKRAYRQVRVVRAHLRCQPAEGRGGSSGT